MGELPQAGVGVGAPLERCRHRTLMQAENSPPEGVEGGEGITQMFRLCRASNTSRDTGPDPTGGNTHTWPRLQRSPQFPSSCVFFRLGEAPACSL